MTKSADTVKGQASNDTETGLDGTWVSLASFTNSKHAKWPQGLALLYDLLMTEAARTLPAERAHALTEQQILAVGQWLGGRPFYLPKSDVLKRAIRDRNIWNAFNGRNYDELCRQFNLCDKQVRNIIDEQRKLSLTEVQPSLL